MDFHALVVPVYITLLIGIVGWLLKTRLDRIEKGMEDIKATQAQDRLNASDKFATWTEHKELAKDLRKHGECIARLEARASRVSDEEPEG